MSRPPLKASFFFYLIRKVFLVYFWFYLNEYLGFHLFFHLETTFKNYYLGMMQTIFIIISIPYVEIM